MNISSYEPLTNDVDLGANPYVCQVQNPRDQHHEGWFVNLSVHDLFRRNRYHSLKISQILLYQLVAQDLIPSASLVSASGLRVSSYIQKC